MVKNCEVTLKGESKKDYKLDIDVNIKFRKESFAKDTVEDLQKFYDKGIGHNSTDELILGLIANIKV